MARGRTQEAAFSSHVRVRKGGPSVVLGVRERPNIWLFLGMGGLGAKAPSLSCIQ